MGLFLLINIGMIYALGYQESDEKNGSGYNQQEESTHEGAPPIVTEHNASAAWISDGIIGDDEYSRSMVLEGKKRGRLTGRKT